MVGDSRLHGSMQVTELVNSQLANIATIGSPLDGWSASGK